MTTSQDRYGDDFGAQQMWGLQELPWPEPVAWWPQTAGWLVVAIVLVLLGAWWLRRRRQAWQRDAWRRAALADLDAMIADPGRLVALPVILRAAALRFAAREKVASLRGPAWIEWLNTSVGRELFAPGDDEFLDKLAYAPDVPVVSETHLRLLDSGRQWLRARHD